MKIGIDLGGTTIHGGLVDRHGVIVKKLSFDTPDDYDVQAIVSIMDQMIDEFCEFSDAVSGIGVGIPGLVSKNMQEVLTCKNLKWTDVPLVRLMKKRAMPIYLDNDANVAALAEYKLGSLKNTQNSMMLTLGTGVGGGIVLNDQMYRGSNGLSFEVGHMVIGDNFYDCNCGRSGCFETFASATAMVKYAKKLLSEGQTSTLSDLNHLDAKAIIEASKLGDELSITVFNRLIKYLSIGIVNLINLFDPEIIAIGGGLSGAGDYLLKPLREKVKSMLFMADHPSAEIVLATMENDAGIIGAALVAQTLQIDSE
jgi:glucokinase